MINQNLLKQLVFGTYRPIIKATTIVPPITEFGRTPVWFNRAVVYDRADTVRPAFATGFPDDPNLYIGTSGGSGRPSFIGIKSVNPTLGVDWTYEVPGIKDTNRIPNSNSENYLVMDSGGDRIFATVRNTWDYANATVDNVSTPTVSTTTSTTSHTVNIPSVVDGDLLIVFVTFSSSVTVTRPAGWVAEREDAIGSQGDAGIYAIRADGSEGSTVSFTTNTAVNGAWHAFKVAAGGWRDTGNLAEAIQYGGSSDSTGTSPNPGGITTTFWGNYSFIVAVHVDAAETINAYPTECTGGVETQSTDVTLATCHYDGLVSGTNYNPTAFTKSGSARYVTHGLLIYPPYSSGQGFIQSDDAGGVACINRSDGSLRWVAPNNSIATGYLSCACNSDGSKVISRAGGTWVGQPTNYSVAILNGDDGSFISTHLPANVGSNTNLESFCFFGVNEDKVVQFSIGGTSGGREIINALPLSDIESTSLWSLNKTLDFDKTFSVISKIKRLSDGSIAIANGDSNGLQVHFVSESGVVEDFIDVTSVHGANGIIPTIRDIMYDKFGHLYILVYASSGSDVLKYDENRNLIWSLIDSGFSQATATPTQITLGTNLLNLSRSLWVGSTGVIYIGEDGSLAQGAYVTATNQTTAF